MAAGRTRAAAQDEHGRALALALALALGGGVVNGCGRAPVPLIRRAARWRGVSLWCLGLSAFGLRCWKLGIINNTAGLRCRLLPTCTCYCCSLLPLQCTSPGLDPAPASSPCPCPLSSHLPLCPRNKFRGLAFSRMLLQEKPSPVLLSRHHTNTGLLSSATCTPPRTTPTPPPPTPRAPAAPRNTPLPRPAPVPCSSCAAALVRPVTT